jgi:hypothetical protein
MTSLTASLSFLLMLLTSIVLYIVPQGRVAYWADWRLWGLTKTDWGNIHINLGTLFFIALALHVYYNWKPLISYLKNRARQFRLFTAEFNAALVLSAVVVLGTYLLVPPFSWVMTLNDHFKEAGANRYGEPPYGHAELSSLETFARKMNLDLERSMALLHGAGYPVEDGRVTLQAVARRYGIAPGQVYEVIRPAAMIAPAAASMKRLPDSPPPGTGNLTLADLSEKAGADPGRIAQELEKRGIRAAEGSTLKQIASDNDISPFDLYEWIRGIVNAG